MYCQYWYVWIRRYEVSRYTFSWCLHLSIISLFCRNWMRIILIDIFLLLSKHDQLFENLIIILFSTICDHQQAYVTWHTHAKVNYTLLYITYCRLVFVLSSNWFVAHTLVYYLSLLLTRTSSCALLTANRRKSFCGFKQLYRKKK